MTPADGEQPGAGATVDAGAADAASAAALLAQGPWYGEIKDPDLKTWAEKNNPKDAESTLKQLRDAQKLIGDGNRVSLPKDGDDITQHEIWDKLNVPKEAKGYEGKIKRPEMPEGLTYDEALEKQYLDHAAKVRTPPHIVQQNIDFIAQQRIAEFNALKEHQTKEAAELQGLLKEWGADKEVNLELTRRGAKYLGWSDAEVKAIESVQGGRDVLTALYKLGKNVREGSAFDGDSSPVVGKEAAKAELARINERVGRGEVLTAEDNAKRTQLYKMVHG